MTIFMLYRREMTTSFTTPMLGAYQVHAGWRGGKKYSITWHRVWGICPTSPPREPSLVDRVVAYDWPIFGKRGLAHIQRFFWRRLLTLCLSALYFNFLFDAAKRMDAKKVVGFILEHIHKHVRDAGSAECSASFGYEFRVRDKHQTDKDYRRKVLDMLTAELPKLGFQQADIKLNLSLGLGTVILELDWSNLRHDVGDRDKAHDKGNLIKECPVCNQDRPMSCLNPCGHLCCSTCHEGKCPICRTEVMTSTPLFNAMEDKSPFGWFSDKNKFSDDVW